jgi:group I intron endonuclease
MARTLIRAGVYMFRNVITGKRYVGSSVKNVHYRRSDHLAQLRHGKHSNRHLQRAWEKYGEKAFVWGVLEYTDDALAREQYYIDTLKPEYNILQVARNVVGCIRSEETRAKISASCKGLHVGSLHHNYGKSVPLETREKIAATLKGAVPWIKGKQHTQEAKDKMSHASKGNTKRKDNPTYKNIKQLDLTGNILALHKTAREAADAVNRLNRFDSSKILRATRTGYTAFGYKWRLGTE